MIRIARMLNCVVVLVHHIGKAKAEEGKTKEPAHRGRGASALSDFATTIFNLEADAADEDKLILACAKRKDGKNYECTMLLNRTTRWFLAIEQIHPPAASKFDLFVETVSAFGRSVKTKGD